MRMLFLLVLLPAAIVSAPAQTPCQSGKQAAATGFWTWTTGARVRVYVAERDFKPAEVSFLVAPLQKWNAVSDSTGSGVRFEYAGRTEAGRFCENCLTITRGAIFDQRRRHVTELRAYSAKNNRLLTWATIVVDFALTKPQALTDAIAHELGHSFGLRDCHTCEAGTTVMRQFAAVNSANNLPGPTTCDVAQIESTYRHLARQPTRVSPPKTLVVDEGEEPADDDTPIIVPKPWLRN